MKCSKCNHVLPDDSEFCQYCGHKIESGFVVSTDIIEKSEEVIDNASTVSTVDNEISIDDATPKETLNTIIKTQTQEAVKLPKSKVSRKNMPNEKLVFFTNLSSVVLTVIAMLSIIIAMSVQDYKRDIYEWWSPTTVYIILLLIFGAFLGVAIYSLAKKRFILISCLSAIPVLATIITTAEGSILGYCCYYKSERSLYDNYDVVDIFNAIWIICIVLVLFITLIPVVAVVVNKISNNWHKSISYREKRYKKVAKMHSYLEKGIITEEEYEETKKQILSKLK